MDFSWRSFAFGFRLPLLIICDELYITCLWFVSSLNLVWDLCLDLNIWLVMCDGLCWFMLLLSFMFILWLWGCANHAKISYHISIVSCMPWFPLVGKTLSKFSNIYMCSWYSWKFMCTYQGGVLSTHRTWWIYPYHILKFSRKWVSSSKVQFQVHLMPSV